MNCENGTLLQAVAALLFMLNADYLRALSDGAFFCTVREYLIDDMLIGTYRDAAAARLGRALGMLSTAVVTGWVLYQGFMVLSGTNRQPMIGLLFKTGKLVFILSLVSLVAGHSPVIADTVLDFQRLVTVAVVGEDTNVYRMIDLNLGLAQVINQVINNVAVGRESGSTGNSLTTAAGLLGQSGPAMITTVLAMLAEIAITFAILLAPLFLFFLLFQQTSSLFWSWAKFLLGTFVSLAALAVVSSIALRMSAIYGASVLAAFFGNGAELTNYDISGSAMRMATMGTLMSAIIISVPPMIMQFFNAGVGFATGAMGGMMGGAAAGRMAGGGTGVPGFGYMGGSAGGAGGGAGGSSSGSYLPGPSRAPEIGSGAGGSEVGVRQIGMTPAGRAGSDAGSSTVLAPGARGLAAPDTALSRVEQINRLQSTSREFREVSAEDDPRSSAPHMGTGGLIRVADDPLPSGNTSSHSVNAGTNRVSAVPVAPLISAVPAVPAVPPSLPGGSAGLSNTSVYAVPPPGTNGDSMALRYQPKQPQNQQSA